MTPGFNVRRSIALHGVVLAYAHVRGGSEKGEAWYKAGYKTTKPNTWKDFISAAEYLIKKGYVGVGRVLAEAVPARDLRVGKTPLRKLRLKAPKMLHDSDDLENCEYVVRVKWLVANKQEGALWKPGLFTTQLVRPSLDNQPKTRRYIEDNWNVRFEDLLAEGE